VWSAGRFLIYSIQRQRDDHPDTCFWAGTPFRSDVWLIEHLETKRRGPSSN
jgi:hypothetical protein